MKIPTGSYDTDNSRSLKSASDLDVLAALVGAREARLAYQGSLTRLDQLRVPKRASMRIEAAAEFVRRSLREELKHTDALSAPGAVRDYLRILLREKPYEVFVVLFLDAANRVIESEEMFRGTLTQTAVYPREVVKAALKHNAAAAIFAHNHPSGRSVPSQADRSLTRHLIDALDLIDVRVLDHFIVAEAKILSFAEEGLM